MNENLNKDLYVKCERNTPKEVRDILRKGADPNGYCDDDGWFPLHYSAFYDKKETAEARAEHGNRVLLCQLSSAIKTQLKAPKTPPTAVSL